MKWTLDPSRYPAKIRAALRRMERAFQRYQKLAEEHFDYMEAHAPEWPRDPKQCRFSPTLDDRATVAAQQFEQIADWLAKQGIETWRMP